MDRKTLTGFILIGAILLLWPSYLDLVSPSEENSSDSVLPNVADTEEYLPPSKKIPLNVGAEGKAVEKKVLVVDGGSYVAKISNLAGGSFVSFDLKNHLKKRTAL